MLQVLRVLQQQDLLLQLMRLRWLLMWLLELLLQQLMLLLAGAAAAAAAAADAAAHAWIGAAGDCWVLLAV